MALEDLRNTSTLLRLSSQLPEDVVDGEGREVALKPLPSQLDLSLSAPFQPDDVEKLLTIPTFRSSLRFPYLLL